MEVRNNFQICKSLYNNLYDCAVPNLYEWILSIPPHPNETMERDIKLNGTD